MIAPSPNITGNVQSNCIDSSALKWATRGCEAKKNPRAKPFEFGFGFFSPPPFISFNVHTFNYLSLCLAESGWSRVKPQQLSETESLCAEGGDELRRRQICAWSWNMLDWRWQAWWGHQKAWLSHCHGSKQDDIFLLTEVREISKTASAFEIYRTTLTYPKFNTGLKMILARLPKNATSAVGGSEGCCQYSSAGRTEELPEYFCLKQTRGFPGSSE